MMYLQLAWRNMWRSRRRTFITISSIFFAVLFAILMRVMMIGIFDKMIADTVSMSTGYIQVHHSGYWENKSIDSTFEENPRLLEMLNSNKHITAWNPHLESFALASSGERTKGILVTGIDPEKENLISRLSEKIQSGRYLGNKDSGILLAQGLAEYLNLMVNDTVVLLGQGYQGNMAAGKYCIRGIAKLPIPQMNKSMAWLPMQGSRDFLNTGARYTSLSLMVSDRTQVDAVKRYLLNQIKGMSPVSGSGRADGLDYEIMTWQEMLPELDQLFQAKMAQNVIMSGILYLVIAFGIFGTILMMLNERMHEFGILIAIGMKKRILAGIVVLELILMSLTGTFLGIAGAVPLVLYFRFHPIHMGGDWARTAEKFNFSPVLQPSVDFRHFIIQGYAVLSIAVVLSLYALVKINRLKTINALNS